MKNRCQRNVKENSVKFTYKDCKEIYKLKL